MDQYLFRISTKTDVWTKTEAKCLYCVMATKKEAEAFAYDRLSQGVSVHKITCLGKQIGGLVFVGLKGSKRQGKQNEIINIISRCGGACAADNVGIDCDQRCIA